MLYHFFAACEGESTLWTSLTSPRIWWKGKQSWTDQNVELGEEVGVGQVLSKELKVCCFFSSFPSSVGVVLVQQLEQSPLLSFLELV